jgi:MSHA biogenesis protein MshJ
MHEKLVEVREKYESLSMREQVMLVMAVAVAVSFIWFQFISEPMYNQTKQASTQLNTLEQSVKKLQQQHQSLLNRRASDPHREVKDRIALIDKQLQNVNKQLAEKFHGLIEPKQMAQVLESVLKKHKDLKLISVRSLASERLIKPEDEFVEANDNKSGRSDEATEQNKVEVYRHGLQIEFEGNYLATLDYLKTLESLDWEFYWDGVQLQVTDYPKSRVVITVHTLSLRDSWLGV